jgi:hypothetical protein
MNDAFGVGGVERVGDLDTQQQQGFQPHRTPAYAVPQRHPVQKLHGNEGMPILLADVVESADVGMIQCGSGLGFPLKAGQGMRVADDVFWQKLEGDEAM